MTNLTLTLLLMGCMSDLEAFRHGARELVLSGERSALVDAAVSLLSEGAFVSLQEETVFVAIITNVAMEVAAMISEIAQACGLSGVYWTQDKDSQLVSEVEWNTLPFESRFRQKHWIDAGIPEGFVSPKMFEQVSRSLQVH